MKDKTKIPKESDQVSYLKEKKNNNLSIISVYLNKFNFSHE